MITEPAKVEIKTPVRESAHTIPDVSVTISNIVAEIVKPKEESIVQEPPVVEESKPIAKLFVEKSKPVDKTWRYSGFKGIRNPFKGGVAPSP